MSLSRRAFLASSAALAGALGVPASRMATALAAPATASAAGTTLEQTVLMTKPTYKQYRTLVAGPGEEYIPRYDLLGKEADAKRTDTRRSLYYLGHFSDIHIIDAQSPARLEPMTEQSPSLWAGCFRPQDPLTVHVAAAMVDAMAAARYSPVTGAPMTAAFVTGDSADMHSYLELRWYIDVLDGESVVPNSGKDGTYEGVQAWEECVYAYHPEDPANDWFGEYGYPTVPGMLTAAVTEPVQSVGMPVPWYTVYGNHDMTFLGTLRITPAQHAWAVGSRKAASYQALGADYIGGLAQNPSAIERALFAWDNNFGHHKGSRTVTPDPDRKLYENQQFMSEHFTTAPQPGPVGHGFTQNNLDTGETWWVADFAPNLRLFGLDTCNQIAGPDGAVPESQFTWLEAELKKARDNNQLAMVLSHHNSTTLENEAVAAIGPTERLIHAPEFIEMLLKYPNCVAWVNGHTHINTITAHPRADGAGGLWEITTASCVDFPQQQQVIELVDNRDGTMSIFCTTLDHSSPAEWQAGDLSMAGLASLSRELAANDWIENPAMRLGSPLDRNVELLLPEPFDLAKIDTAALAKAQTESKARLVAFEQEQKS